MITDLRIRDSVHDHHDKQLSAYVGDEEYAFGVFPTLPASASEVARSLRHLADQLERAERKPETGA